MCYLRGNGKQYRRPLAFACQIVEVTRTSRIDVEKKLQEVKKYYVDALQYLKAYADVGASTTSVASAQGTLGTSLSAQVAVGAPSGFDEFKVGDLRIWLRPDNLDDVSTAIALLQVIESKLKAKKPSGHFEPQLTSVLDNYLQASICISFRERSGCRSNLLHSLL